MTLEIERSTSSRGRNRSRRVSYVLYLRFSFEEETYSFTIADFAKTDRKDTLLYMQSVKECFGERCTLVGTEFLEAMLERYDFEPEEKDILYELFELK